MIGCTVRWYVCKTGLPGNDDEHNDDDDAGRERETTLSAASARAKGSHLARTCSRSLKIA